jgi:MtN3 and saliva related transmembrane protein
MTWITILGLAAAAGTTISFLPQVIKTLKTKQTKDISLWMYIIFTTGVFLWLVYGFLIKDIPLIIANAITFAFAGIILILKISAKGGSASPRPELGTRAGGKNG